MGVAANQARLLALTARKCSLEEAIQKLLNTKVAIARETARISNVYNDAISNRKLFVFTPTANKDETIYEDLSAANLFNRGGYIVAKKVPNGTSTTYTQINTNDPKAIEQGLRNGEMVLMQAADLGTQDVKDVTIDYTYAGSQVFSGADDPTIPTNGKWEVVKWENSTLIMDELDKSDDAEALRRYEEAMNQLEIKEAGIDLEINETETSHTAVSNEMESVKKVLTKNTEESFKYFS